MQPMRYSLQNPPRVAANVAGDDAVHGARAQDRHLRRHRAGPPHAAGIVLMLLGSCDYKTRREAESSAADAATSATDGFDEWAWLPALSALVAIVLLGNVAATQTSGRS